MNNIVSVTTTVHYAIDNELSLIVSKQDFIGEPYVIEVVKFTDKGEETLKIEINELDDIINVLNEFKSRENKLIKEKLNKVS